jgi:hypothetical protein
MKNRILFPAALSGRVNRIFGKKFSKPGLTLLKSQAPSNVDHSAAVFEELWEPHRRHKFFDDPEFLRELDHVIDCMRLA